jgi:hypothetical protein
LAGTSEPTRPVQPAVVVHDIQIGAPPGVSTKGAKLPKVRQKPTILTYEHKQFRAGFVEPEYDLAEIYKAMDTESYMRLSYDKHEELILKGQWKLVGQNEQTLSYVLRRVAEISWSQDEPFERIIESGIEDLVESHNVFYVLARRDTGRLYKSRFGRMLAPITGIFSPNSASMRPFIETSWKTQLKHIKEWWQITGGRIIKKFRPHNVVHMAFRKKKGHIFGTPYVVPVLDDILAMRRLEELVEILVHKHAFPFFHYRVGTEQEPAREFDDGHSEVDDVRAEISSMPFEGGLVTPYRHEIVVLGTRNKAVNAEPYLKYFEARVLSGLNLSGIDIGRGETANRSTAQTMSKGLSDRCTRFQNFFSAWFTFKILDEFVYEIGVIPSPENRVYLVFSTIDKEEERAHENHTLAMYQGSLITEVEARTKIGMDPIKPAQRKDLYFNRVAKPLAIIKAIDEPYTGEAKSAMGSKGAVANREQPENKSKRLTSKPKVSANDALPFIESVWIDMQYDILTSLDGPAAFCEELKDTLSIWVGAWMNKGLERYRSELKPAAELYLGTNIKEGFLADVLEPKVSQLESRMRSSIDTGRSVEDRQLLLESAWPLIEQLADQIEALSESYSYARIAQVDKHKSVHWELTDEACPTCKERGSLLIHKFSWEEMQYHDGCTIKLIVDS